MTFYKGYAMIALLALFLIVAISTGAAHPIMENDDEIGESIEPVESLALVKLNNNNNNNKETTNLFRQFAKHLLKINSHKQLLKQRTSRLFKSQIIKTLLKNF